MNQVARATSQQHSARFCRGVAAVLLILHAALIAGLAHRQAPTLDEAGHLAAGLSYWRLGTFELYRVNPPLTRLIASAPSHLRNVEMDWSEFISGPTVRPEWTLGRTLIDANPENWRQLVTSARLALLPLVLIGPVVCYLWARDLYGPMAGVVALAFWCLSPNLIAWSATISPDAATASTGVLAGYTFWRWLRAPDWENAMIAGAALGVALLTKSTWIILPGLWLLLAMIALLSKSPKPASVFVRGAAQLLLILGLGAFVLNVGYLSEGSFRGLGEYTFVSRPLAGADAAVDGGTGGNVFRDKWLGAVPIPLPEPFVSGVDLQKLDFERGGWSYLNGRWQHGGWWYYHCEALLLKEPLAVWLALVLTIVLTIVFPRHYFAGGIAELAVIAPGIAVLLLVSSETGFSRYVRYVIPCLPFVYVWISKLARGCTLRHRFVCVLLLAGLAWSALSSLAVYPYSMSYFNELAGGPKNGHNHLLDANIDWGQDVWDLAEWCERNPQARPFYADLNTFVEGRHFGLKADRVRTAWGDQLPLDLHERAGWYAISIHRLRSREGEYAKLFAEQQPVDRIGYSIYIYRVAPVR